MKKKEGLKKGTMTTMDTSTKIAVDGPTIWIQFSFPIYGSLNIVSSQYEGLNVNQRSEHNNLSWIMKCRECETLGIFKQNI